MKIIRKIALTELQSLFYSPVAWFIIIVFTIQSAMALTDYLGSFLRLQDMNSNLSNLTQTLFGKSGRSLFPQVVGYLYLYIPILTMGIMSREISSGSIKLLYSSPVRNSQIILGKYLSLMVYGLFMVAILFLFVLFGSFTIANFDWPVALVQLLGVYLLICAYAAIGLFMSSLTSYQVVAGIGTLAILALLNYLPRLGQGIDVIREMTYWMNISGRVNGFILGLVSSEDLLYFLLIISMFLSLTILRLKAIRQKAKGVVVWTKYAGVVLVVMIAGYFTSLPAMKIYYDATHTKQLTLTPNSQEIIARAEGPMTIVSYVNALHPRMNLGLPQSRMRDRLEFEQYLRFKPEIKMKYIYYYAMPENNTNFVKRYPGMDAAQIMGRICAVNKADSTLFKPVDELSLEDQKMLAAEGYEYVRVLDRGNGLRTPLRFYNDIPGIPSERETTAALKRLVMELPVVGFVGGHGQRSINDIGDRGYFLFSQHRQFRNALINQGFEITEVMLDEPVPPHINILVIADMREPLTSQQEVNLDVYIERGGNMIIAGEVNRQEIMNPVAEKFGVSFMPGQVVRVPVPDEEKKHAEVLGAGGVKYVAPESNFPANLVLGHLTDEGGDMNYMYRYFKSRKRVVTMPGCVGLSYATDSGYEVMPLLVSDLRGSWNELQTTDFVDGVPAIDVPSGEKEESLPLALTLTRETNDRQQKVLILGDADCMSNSELNLARANIPASNFDLIMSTFCWLSDDEVPIDVRRPATSDNKILVSSARLDTWKILLAGVFPGTLLVVSLFIWLRRRGR